MSARQRARIANQSALLAHAAECDESDSDSGSLFDEPAAPRFRFGTSSDSSSSDNESRADEQLSLPAKHHSDTGSLLSEMKAVVALDDISFLDTAIAHNANSPFSTNADDPDSALESLELCLFCFKDAGGLDIGTALRRRGDEGGPRPFEPQPQRRGGRGLQRGLAPPARTNVVAGKTYIFGQPSEDWMRPPSYSAGGFGMQSLNQRSKSLSLKGKKVQPEIPAGKGTKWFAFSWSQDYAFLCAQYVYIQATEDANLLVMFLAHFPYFHVGLVQLALIYARAGQFQKAVQLTRRALYGFECATLESMKPRGIGSGRAHSSVCRMDPAQDENADYFATLLVHMRICGALGYPTVAADLCRYQLWLCPQDSAHGLLLVLDHLLVAAGHHAVLRQYCGVDAEAAATVTTTLLPVAAEVAAAVPLLQCSFRSPYLFAAFSLAERGSPAGAGTGKEAAGNRALEHLPNWWFSLALSERIQSLRKTAGAQFATAGADASALERSAPSPAQRLQSALLHWPFMLRPLLARCGAADLSSRGPWSVVLQHPLFNNAEQRLNEESYLGIISAVYAELSAPLWDKEEHLRWLLQSALELIQQLSTAGHEQLATVVSAQKTFYAELCAESVANSYLAKYAQVSADSLSSRFPPFPGGESPLDPSLDDPEYLLSGAVRFRDFVNAEGEFMFPVPAPYACTLRGKRALRQHLHADFGSGSEADSGDELNVPRYGAGLNQLLEMNWRRGGWDGPAGNDGAAGGWAGAQSNIDFNLPLMQLFLATLFPWIFVQPLPRG